MSLKAIRQRLGTDTHFLDRDPAAPAPIAPAAETLERKERERQPHPPRNRGDFGAIGAEGADASPSKSEFVAEGAIGAAYSAFAPDVLKGREFDLTAFAERAAIIEYDGRLPRAEAEEAAARDMGYGSAEALYSVAIGAWRFEIEAAPKTGNPDLDNLAAVSLLFLASDWATKALVADWDETALFAIHEGQSPKERIVAWGLVPLLAWGVHRCTIEGFSRNACELRTQRGATLRQPRMRVNFDEAVPWWRHPGISHASMAR